MLQSVCGDAGSNLALYVYTGNLSPATRRFTLSALMALPLIGRANTPALAQNGPTLPLTLSCEEGHDVTLERQGGPYFRPNSPNRHGLYADAPGGERITVEGFIVDEHRRPVPDALIEIWHAAEHGNYDSNGFKLRGHQFTDADGRWWVKTIVPALYPGRTRHFHFRMQRQKGRVLTTQLFFPGEPAKATDWLFHETLVLKMEQTGDGYLGRFGFVV